MLEEQQDEGKWAHTILRTLFLVLVIIEVFFFIQSKQLSKLWLWENVGLYFK